MQNDHAGIIKGLGITSVVISGLVLAGCLLGYGALALGGYALNEYLPGVMDYAREGGASASYYYGGHHYDFSDSDWQLANDSVMGISNLALIVAGAVLAWEVLGSVISLIAGILGIRNAGNAHKLGSVFGWGIAGAVLAALGGRFITAVVLAVMAVFAGMDRKAAANPPHAHAVSAAGATWQQAPEQPTWAQPMPYIPYDQAYAQPAAQQYAPQQNYAPRQVEQPASQQAGASTPSAEQPAPPLATGAAAATDAATQGGVPENPEADGKAR